MISLHNRSFSAFCLAIALLSLSLVWSCQPAPPDSGNATPGSTPGAKTSDPREELVRSLKGANVDGFLFATEEQDNQVVTSLTNSAVRNLITLDKGATNLVLRYTSVKDKKANSTQTTKTEVVKTGNALALQVTDIATGQVVSKDAFPPPGSHVPTGPTFDTLEACIQDFNCTRRGALQCEADRTCKNQFAALTCCLKNGQCFSVHLIIRPTRLRCLVATFPDLEGLVLSQ
jgi:hypothetical protein